MKFTTRFELHSQATRLVENASHAESARASTGFSPSVMPCSKGLVHRPPCEDVSLAYNSSLATGFQLWALPASLAVTKGILVSFFSSTY
jgi:hypothetical protein